MNARITELIEGNQGHAKLQLDWGAAGLVASLAVQPEGAHTPLSYRGEGATMAEAMAALEADITALADKPKAADIYTLARQVVEGNGGWSAGQTRTVWQGKAAKVTIGEHGRDGGGLLSLRAYNGKTHAVQCGHLDPMAGRWVWTLSRNDYAAWAERAKGKGERSPSPSGPKVVVTSGGNVTTDGGKIVNAWCDRCNRGGLPSKRHGGLHCICGNVIAKAGELAQDERDAAMPVQHERGRSKLFKV